MQVQWAEHSHTSPSLQRKESWNSWRPIAVIASCRACTKAWGLDPGLKEKKMHIFCCKRIESISFEESSIWLANLTQRGPWIAQWLRWIGPHVATLPLASRVFDWRRQNRSLLGTVPPGPLQTNWRKLEWTEPAAGLPRGSGDSWPVAASPGSPAEKPQNVGMTGFPRELGRELDRLLLGLNPSVHLQPRIFNFWNKTDAWLIDWLQNVTMCFCTLVGLLIGLGYAQILQTLLNLLQGLE